MFRYTCFLLVVCSLLLPCAFSQSSNPVDASTILGTWSNAGDQNDRLQLRAGGEFSLDEHGQHYDGQWELQGQTLVLNLTPTDTTTAQWDGKGFVDDEQKRWVRTSAVAVTPAPPPGTPAPPAAQPQKSASVSGEPPCPAQPGVYYLRGSSWQSMTQLRADANAARVRPIPFATTAKSVAIYQDTMAPVTLGETPKFCVNSNMLPRNLVVAMLDVKSDHREIPMMEMNQYTGTKLGIPEKKIQPITVKRASDTVIEISLRKPLTPGQYMIFPFSRTSMGYDFGVAAGVVP